MALTTKQAAFVAEYLKDRNGTRAARDAGYLSPEVEQNRLLKTAKIAAEIAKGQAAQVQRTNITLDYVLQRLAIEAERDDDRASHSARVAALGQLRQHLEGTTSADDAPASMSITVNGLPAQADIRVTRHSG